jgi:uncharacterized membrane protein
MENFPKMAILLFLFLSFSIFFNIPVLRQVLGFLWLSLIPGYTLLRLLKLDKWDSLDMLVFSIGLGLAIVMFLGLFLNSVCLALNFPNPLSATPFIAVLGLFTLFLLLVGRNQDIKEAKSRFSNLNIKIADIPQIFLMSAVLFLSIAGALYRNVPFLLFMIIGVALLTLMSILSERYMPSRLFTLVILTCSIALLFHTALISQHLMGVDIFMEFYVFTKTKARGVWIASGNLLYYSLLDDLNSILSVTLLPTVGTSILGIDGETFFKLFYPIVFSMVPLALYTMYRQQVDAKTAFLATMVYVALPTAFYGIEPLALCRQMLSQLFLVLSVALTVDKKVPLRKKKILLIIFVSAVITTHYSLAFIWLLYALVFYVAPRVPFNITSARRRLDSRTIDSAVILLFIALTFSWYIYVSSSPLNHLLSSFNKIADTFIRDFSRPEARGFGGALSSLSPLAPTSIVGLTHKILVYTHFFFISLGIVVMTIKPEEFSISYEYRLLSLINAALIAFVLLVPNLGTTFNATRFYTITILFLSPFYVLGGRFLISLIASYISKISDRFAKINARKLGLYTVTFVLIATFLFQVGFVNHITNDYPYSYSLDLNRKEASNRLDIKVIMHSLYFIDQEVLSAEWLAKKAGVKSQVYADWNSQCSVLKCYAQLLDSRTVQIANQSKPETGAYVYLKYINTQLGLVTTTNALLNSSDALPAITNYDVIYSNGISDIYFVP